MYYYILLHTTTTCYYMLLHATTYYYIRLHTTVWCSAAALETVHHTRGRRQQATAPAQRQRRGAPKHRSGTPTGILSTWHDANTEGGTTPFLTLSTTVRCWVCLARLALKHLSAVWLGGCSCSAASMAAATKALAETHTVVRTAPRAFANARKMEIGSRAWNAPGGPPRVERSRVRLQQTFEPWRCSCHGFVKQKCSTAALCLTLFDTLSNKTEMRVS